MKDPNTGKETQASACLVFLELSVSLLGMLSLFHLSLKVICSGEPPLTHQTKHILNFLIHLYMLTRLSALLDPKITKTVSLFCPQAMLSR